MHFISFRLVLDYELEFAAFVEFPSGFLVLRNVLIMGSADALFRPNQLYQYLNPSRNPVEEEKVNAKRGWGHSHC